MLHGYSSTTTNKDLVTEFAGSRNPIHFKITANKGLDTRPYSEQPQEDEVLLNNASSFRVKSIKEDRMPDGRDYHVVELEQIDE